MMMMIMAQKKQANNNSEANEEIAPQTMRSSANVVAVLLFSGFTNAEMLATYNILGPELYQETGRPVACAKAVPNALRKPLRQVLDEIAGDHRDAMTMDTPTAREE